MTSASMINVLIFSLLMAYATRSKATPTEIINDSMIGEQSTGQDLRIDIPENDACLDRNTQTSFTSPNLNVGYQYAQSLPLLDMDPHLMPRYHLPKIPKIFENMNWNPDTRPVEEFLNEVEALKAFANIPDQAVIYSLAYLMPATYRTWFCSNITVQASWEAAKEKLISQFGLTSYRNVVFNSIREIHQTPTENFRQFSNRVLEKYVLIKDFIPEPVIVHYLCANMKSNYRQSILWDPLFTITSLCYICNRYDDSQTFSTPGGHNAVIETQKFSTAANGSRSEARSSPIQSSRVVRCYQCNKQGHIRWDCPNRRPPNLPLTLP